MTFSRTQKALQLLQMTSDRVLIEERDPLQLDLVRPRKLRDATISLAKFDGAGKPQQTSEETENKWRAGVRDLTKKEIRQLCWSSEIFLDKSFHDLLVMQRNSISASMIKGLMYCYQATYLTVRQFNWMESIIKSYIGSYSGTNRSVLKWRDSCHFLLGSDASTHLGHQLISNPEIEIAEQLAGYSVYDGTDFKREVLRTAITSLCKRPDFGKASDILILFEQLLPDEDLLKDDLAYSISELALSIPLQRSEQARELLVSFVLRNQDFGDPRISPQKWLGVSEAAKGEIIRWLARDDIKFFFDLIIKESEDPHRRKSFWMPYADQVIRSRPLICDKDLLRHDESLERLAEEGRVWGRLDTRKDTSAFILDFQKLIIVEFSRPNNACYAYTPEGFRLITKNFWVDELDIDALKRTNICEKYFAHGTGWERRLRAFLAQYGIRGGGSYV